MTYPRYTPILLGLLLIVGCSPRSGEESLQPEDTYDYTTTVVDGVRVITNPEESWKGRVEYTAADEACRVTVGGPIDK